MAAESGSHPAVGARIRVLHAPTAVGGNAAGLAEAERELGLDSRAFACLPNPFGYSGYGTRPRAGRGLAPVFWRMLQVYWRAVSGCDVLHLNFGRTILDAGPNVVSRLPAWTGARGFTLALQAAELGGYRLGRVPVFMTFQGNDARQGEVSLQRFRVNIAEHVGKEYYTPSSDRMKQRRIELYRSRIQKIYYLNPDLGWVLPAEAEFVPYASVKPAAYQVVSPLCERGIPHLVHAPSHRGVKGTPMILEALERLRREGYKFRLSLVEGMPFAEARRMYEAADLVIDQILAGWYGGLAVECMAMGKPVIAYLREDDFRFIPREMAREIPVISAEPETTYEVLRDWLGKGRQSLVEQGSRARAFVEKWHDPLTIARRMQTDYLAALARLKRGREGHGGAEI